MKLDHGFLYRMKSLLFCCSVFALILLLAAGCGSTPGGDKGDAGDVIISLTDADGDFLTYKVNVVSMTLTKANGTIVETLPIKTTIDFAQYVEMTEFFTVATIPPGRYTHATMRLDYTDAEIQVEKNGTAVDAALVDINGNPITEMELTVKLDDRRSLIIAPGIPAHLTLDFDLDASHEVDLTQYPPAVTVKPFLIADVEPEHPKPHRLRGLLQSVDVDTGTFDVRIRHHSYQDTRFGSIEVQTTADTHYEIDGISYQGSEGLAILDNMPVGTAILVFGNLLIPSRQFEASEVYAGTSVPWGTLDIVTGNVVGRAGNDLTVRGATIVRTNGSIVFHDNITVHTGVDTKVTRQIPLEGDLTIQDISVGQRITAAGTLTGTGPEDFELDATAGHVRMLITELRGEVVSVAPGSLVINLQTIDRRKVGIFNFTGTGKSSVDDADPSQYEIDTGGLSLASVNPSDPIIVRGFVSPFGSAPPDFMAQTVIGVSAREALMGIVWRNRGTTGPPRSPPEG